MIRKVGGLYHWQIGNYGGSFYRKAVKRSKSKALVPYEPAPLGIGTRLALYVAALSTGFFGTLFFFN